MDNIEEQVELTVSTIIAGDEQLDAYSLVLEDSDGFRELTIVIGQAEAQAIAFKLKGIKMPRPFTHDLFYNLATTLGVTLESVFIYKVVDGVFYSSLNLIHDGKPFKLDSRTSDAVVLAYCFDAPIYTTDLIMISEGFQPNIVEMEESDRTYALGQLQESLTKALEDEDYEKASSLRDQIYSLLQKLKEK